MPNRILREGILTSDRVNSLTPAAELFYRRLMSVVDDFGRFDGRIVMLKVACFPLRVNEVREADIPRWIAECVKAGLLLLYAVNGKPFLEMSDFRQAVRAKQSKYPSPASATPPPPPCDACATHPHGKCAAHAPVVGVGVEDGGEAALEAPTPEHRELAASLGLNPETEWASFTDYCQAKGRRYKDRAAAFRNWLRQERKWAERDGRVPKPAGPRRVAL